MNLALLFKRSSLATGSIFSFTMLMVTPCHADKQAQSAAFKMTPEMTKMLYQNCTSCHDEFEQEGDVRLDQLGSLALDARLDLLNKMQENIHFKQMPPKDEKVQPTEAEREGMMKWISAELKKHNASKLEDKLRLPDFGNHLDHNKLFSGKYKDLPGSTRDRRWLISEFIFDAKINQLIDHPSIRTIDGKRTKVIGDNGVTLGTKFGGGSLRQSITNPFLLPPMNGVRYYDTTALAKGHLLTMISNARKISAHMTAEPTMKAHYPAMYSIMKMGLAHENTLQQRESFLTMHIERLANDIYKGENKALLPKFVRTEVAKVSELEDKKRNPKKEDNIEILRRFEPQDLHAIYLGVGMYKNDDVSFEQVIEKCERDWFAFGVHEKRISSRVKIMHSMINRWDMKVIYKDIRKKKIKPPVYKPLADEEMKVIIAGIKKHRKQGDGYRQIIEKCMNHWKVSFKSERDAVGIADENQIGDLVDELFSKILEREPTQTERKENITLTKNFIKSLGNQAGIAKLSESLILSSELVYRYEFGQGSADDHGRRMMSPRDASYALAFAITDSAPDKELVAAVKEGRLSNREDYKREVTRMLKRRDQYYVIDEVVQKAGFNSSITNTPIRKLRFFREFFGYPKALTLFKDDARFNAAWSKYDDVKGRVVDEADMLVDHILKKDKNIFEELLTTEKFYVYHSGNNEAMKTASDRLKKIYDYFKVHDWKNFTSEELYEHWDFINEMKMMGTVFPNFLSSKRKKGWIRSFKTMMTSYTLRFGNGQKAAPPYDAIMMAHWNKGEAATRTGTRMRGEEVGRLYNIDYTNWNYPTTQPAKIPNRKGMLTHPAWLIAHSLNLENDPVRRGKWVREKLLAGTILDVPITVDAVIPEDHHKTLRTRLEKKTSAKYCWKCHQNMDPLGLPFEIFDDFGRFRTKEAVEHPENIIKEASKDRGIQFDGRPTFKTLPVNSAGLLDSTGDKVLDGKVTDALDLTDRLAKSPRVRQSIIRHAFRYFMGRNEVLSDSKTLIDAEQAYLENDGSFDAVIISLLTSDSFIYRTSTTK